MKLAEWVYFSFNFLYIKQFNQKNGKEGEKYLKNGVLGIYALDSTWILCFG